MIGSNNKKGFTLIELMVVIFLFSTVVIIISSTITQAFAVQRRSLQFQQVEENVRIVMETIAKEIRVSEIAPGVGTCSDSIFMIHPLQGPIAYDLDSEGRLMKVTGFATTAIVTSNTIEFTNLEFCTQGTLLDDDVQPRVVMVVGVKNKLGDESVVIDLQTTISLRKLID